MSDKRPVLGAAQLSRRLSFGYDATATMTLLEEADAASKAWDRRGRQPKRHTAPVEDLNDRPLPKLFTPRINSPPSAGGKLLAHGEGASPTGAIFETLYRRGMAVKEQRIRGASDFCLDGVRRDLDRYQDQSTMRPGSVERARTPVSRDPWRARVVTLERSHSAQRAAPQLSAETAKRLAALSRPRSPVQRVPPSPRRLQSPPRTPRRQVEAPPPEPRRLTQEERATMVERLSRPHSPVPTDQRAVKKLKKGEQVTLFERLASTSTVSFTASVSTPRPVRPAPTPSLNGALHAPNDVPEDKRPRARPKLAAPTKKASRTGRGKSPTSKTSKTEAGKPKPSSKEKSDKSAKPVTTSSATSDPSESDQPRTHTPPRAPRRVREHTPQPVQEGPQDGGSPPAPEGSTPPPRPPSAGESGRASPEREESRAPEPLTTAPKPTPFERAASEQSPPATREDGYEAAPKDDAPKDDAPKDNVPEGDAPETAEGEKEAAV